MSRIEGNLRGNQRMRVDILEKGIPVWPLTMMKIEASIAAIEEVKTKTMKR
jgi:hypothetical protein